MDIREYMPLGFRDRRHSRECVQKSLISVTFLLWCVTLALAQGNIDLNEHSQSIMEAQWWIIGGLFALIQIIIMLFYSFSQKANSASARAIIESIAELNRRYDKSMEMLLDTRATLLELHGEHKTIMERCHNRNKKGDD